MTAAARDCSGIQSAAVLVQLGHQQALTQLHIALLWLELADQKLQQGGLAHAIGPDQGDAVTAMDALAEVAHDLARLLAVAIGKAHAFGIDDLGAAARALRRFHLDIAQLADLLAAIGAHAAQPFQPALIALAPGGDAIAHPVFLRRDPPLQLVTLHLFLVQHLVAPGFEGSKAFLQPVGLPAIQPHRCAGEILQEPAVMADQHQRPAAGLDLLFQPLDGAHIQVIGGLIQQQDVGPWRQHPGQRGAARLTAGQMRRVFRPAEAQIAQQVKGTVGILMPGFQSRFDMRNRGWWHSR